MSDQIREACERVRRVLGGEPTGIVYRGFAFPSEAFIEETQAVATLHLADHPADDDQAITPEWLVSVGFDRDEHGELWLDGNHEIGLRYDGVWWLDRNVKHEIPIVRPLLESRGDLRRLASALGIQLKESHGGG